MPHPHSPDRPEVLFFDVNETLIDLAQVRQSVAQALHGGPEVATLWFTRMLQYALVTTVCDQYRNFDEVGLACLQMLARSREIDLTEQQAREILQPVATSPPHPEVPAALESLKDAGYQLAALTNSSRAVMERQLKHAGLAALFDASFSVEDIGIFKPHRHVYRWAARRMHQPPDRCLMIAAHGWDVAGAMWADMRAAFIARPGQQPFPLALTPEIHEPDMTGAAEALRRMQ